MEGKVLMLLTAIMLRVKSMQQLSRCINFKFKFLGFKHHTLLASKVPTSKQKLYHRSKSKFPCEIRSCQTMGWEKTTLRSICLIVHNCD